MKSLDIKLALSALGIVAMLTSPAFAQKPHHVTHMDRSAIYNVVPGYNPQTNSNDPALTGGGTLGYNENIPNG
jgi:hypothetical protein